jgi:hypothetical protein
MLDEDEDDCDSDSDMPKELDVSVSLSKEAYDSLIQKASMADMLMAEQQAAEQMSRQNRVADLLQPLYDSGLISTYCQLDEIAGAICCLGDGYSEGYELEFSEGRTATSPLDVICAVFEQIGTKAVMNSEFAIEFGEMSLPEPEAPVVSKNTPKGMSTNPEMAKVDQDARAYCKANGLDASNNKDYITAVKAVTKGKA